MSFVLALVLTLASGSTVAQTRRRAPAKPPARPAPVRTVTAPADLMCPNVLGTGIATQRVFCDILTERDPSAGAIVRFPEHRGPLTLRFDLHNRHTYSDEEVRARRGYALYTGTIGVLTLDNTLISRAIVQGEFRRREDLFDRVGGGAGGSVKAVAPLGVESIIMPIPADADAISFLGEKLDTVRADGPATYTAPGRPVAIISNVEIEYTPAPAKR